MEYFTDEEQTEFFQQRFKRLPHQNPNYFAQWCRRLDWAVWVINSQGNEGKALAVFDNDSRTIFRSIVGRRPIQ